LEQLILEEEMTDEKRRKKAAQAIQALLELDGIKTTTKDISEKIENESLVDLIKLKDKLANDMRTISMAASSDRHRIIGNFVVANWNLIQDNIVIKDVLLKAYSMGPYKKEQRETMKQELLSRVKSETDNQESNNTQENEPLDHRQCIF